MSSSFQSSYFSSCYLCLLLVLALFHFCLSNQNSHDVLCMDDERNALLRFKHGLIDETHRLASWVGEENDCCKWTGIVCDNFTGHVHQIHLPGANDYCGYPYIGYPYIVNKEHEEASKQRLKGELSPSLLYLKQLEHLDLSCNDFGWIQIPSFIGSLGSLRYLNLSHSMFGGTIPPQLGNLSELHILCLGSFYSSALEMTSMTNMQWLSSLRLLHHLDMSGVHLGKAIDWFQVINTLPSLVQLHLSGCQLSVIHPHVASLNLTSLSLLDLSFNSFDNSFVPRWIFSITSLVSLDLSGCGFHGAIPSNIYSFRNLTSLELLHVSGNKFMNSSLVLKELSSVGSNLISLDISSCGVSSSVLCSLHNLTSLFILGMSDNQLTNAIPKSFCNLCNLRHVYMGGNYFSDISLTSLLESFFECKSPRLESLSLWSSDIAGHLPDQLGQLINLVHLNLDRNNIVGPIPHSIGGLSSLETLDLSLNQLNGNLPDSFGQLSKLDHLDLSLNQLNGSLPDSLGQLSKLVHLDLSLNQLNGSLPDSLGQLSKLNHLGISYNFLTGVVTEAHFAKLTRLKYLKGTGNSLTLRPRLANWIPSFQLETMYLNSWGLGPQFPLWLQLQRDLIYLDISNTSISSPVPESFWRSFPNLAYLDMSHNHIQGTFLGIPAPLFTLDLSYNEFRGQLPDLSNISLIYRLLDLSNNFFVGSLHHLLCPYEAKRTMAINLGNNHLSGDIPECWENWSRLGYLNLENNNLSGRIPRTLGFLSSLELLNMHGNKLSGRLPDSLKNLTHLKFLQLGRNELVGSIPSWIGRELSFLNILNLRSNKFDGNIPHELCYLTAIHILDLAQNNLSGNIPRCFNNFGVLSTNQESIAYPLPLSPPSIYGSIIPASDSLVTKRQEYIYSTILKDVRLLDLSCNSFSGHIPSELMALRELHSLNLSRNQLIGRIPENIGDMKSLESFDVSLNKLYGELPMSLSRLSFLSSFNVSYNNLTGRIPSSSQLQGFNESSFFGNKLCGNPLTECYAVEVPDRDQEEHNGSPRRDWGLIISLVFGFIAGFWVVVAPLIVSTTLRYTYFRFLSELRYMFCDVIRNYCCNAFPK